jgi:hypothetical protein
MYKKNLKLNFRSAAILMTAVSFCLLITACATTPPKPEWITDYPADNDYYIGIGSSNNGNEAEDNEIARKRAMTTLAAEISAVIMSEVNIRTTDDNLGNYESRAVEEITQLVEQNLKAVETVDAWYSPESGYWYYMRLNKAEWLRIQQREMADIERRVKNLVEPVLGNKNRTVADILPILIDGWSIVAESTYTGMIETEMMGEQGALIDLLEKQIAWYVGSLTIKLAKEEVAAEAGRPVELVFTVESSVDNEPGQLQIDLRGRDGSATLIACTTSTAGRYSDSIDLSGLEVGKNYITAVLNTDVLGYKDKAIGLNPPKKDFLIDLQKIKTKLDINYSGDLDDFENATSTFGSVKAILSDTLPVEIDNSGGRIFAVDFNLNYRNAPPNDYGFTIIYVKANISIMRGGNNVYTYETDEVKGAGLNWTQANSKALDKLFEALSFDTDFSNEAFNAFTID